MVMCVCASISPGNPVYFERSIFSAPAGIADASVVTARMRSPSTITMALVQSFPLASQSLPKRTAFIGLAPGFSCAQIPPPHDAPRNTTSNIFIVFMAHSSLRLRTYMLCNVRLLIQLAKECNREELLVTDAGGPQGKAPVSARKKSSPKAWGAQLQRSGNRGPIAEEFWHRAFPWHSAHALPGISWSLQS